MLDMTYKCILSPKSRFSVAQLPVCHKSLLNHTPVLQNEEMDFRTIT